MSENKTKPTESSVQTFLESVADERRRADCQEIARLMQEVTGEAPRMWGESMVGFGQYHYRYASGREGDAMITGFSPRKDTLTLYIMAGFDEYEDLMSRLGKYKTGKSCLYIKKLDDVDREVLKALVQRSVEHMRKEHPAG